jgi:hypothetical protein
MRDPAVFDLDDRAESIVVFHACYEDRHMNLVFDDDDMAAVCLMGNQLITADAPTGACDDANFSCKPVRREATTVRGRDSIGSSQGAGRR